MSENSVEPLHDQNRSELASAEALALRAVRSFRDAREAFRDGDAEAAAGLVLTARDYLERSSRAAAGSVAGLATELLASKISPRWR